jgi:hypothetical protein
MDRQISEDIDVENFTETAMNSMLIQAGCQVKPGSKRSAPNDREDMIMRKKLRNRESAQRARDRQKAKMRWLEEELQKMKTSNEQIMRENILLKHMLSEAQSNKNNAVQTSPPQPNTQLALQLQQQQRINQLQIQRLQMQHQQTVQQVQAKLAQEQSHDSDNSLPSNISTGSNNIAMKGDDLLKFAANRTQEMNAPVQQQPVNVPFNVQQHYAAALAALAQNNLPPFGDQVTVDKKQRPSSVGGSNPSNCNTSDDDKAH